MSQSLRPLTGGRIIAAVFAIALLGATDSTAAIFGREGVSGAEQTMQRIEHFDLIRADVDRAISIRSIETLRATAAQLLFFDLKNEAGISEFTSSVLQQVRLRLTGSAEQSAAEGERKSTKLTEQLELVRDLVFNVLDKRLTIALGVRGSMENSIVVVEMKDNSQRNYFSERMAEYRLAMIATDPANCMESQEQIDVRIGNAVQSQIVWHLTNVRLRTVETFAFVGNAFVYSTGEGTMADALRLRETGADMLSVSSDIDNLKLAERMGTGAEDAPPSDIAVFIKNKTNASVLLSTPTARPEAYAVRYDPSSRKTYEKLVTSMKPGETKLLASRLSPAGTSVTRFFGVNTTLLFAWSGSGRLWWSCLDRLQAQPIFDRGGKKFTGRELRETLINVFTGPDPYQMFDRFEGEHAIGLIWKIGRASCRESV